MEEIEVLPVVVGDSQAVHSILGLRSNAVLPGEVEEEVLQEDA